MKLARPCVLVVIAAVAGSAATGTASASTITALDNTLAGPLSGNRATISDTDWVFKTFTVGTSNVRISSMKMGLYSEQAVGLSSTFNITWELYTVDGSNNPGTLLASDTQSQVLAGSGTANPSTGSQYYTYATGGTLGSYFMQAGQTYGILVKTDDLDANEFFHWTRVDPNTVYSTGTSGFTFGANRRTGTAGSSWFNNTAFYNAWQLNVTTAAAVPGSGLAAIGALGLAGVARRRRR